MASHKLAAVKPPNGARDTILAEASQGFVETAEVAAVSERALAYLEAGYPVHLCGPAGIGKTTLAFHIASSLGQAVTLLHGNDEFGGRDLFGSDAGYRRSKLVDNFIHSVLRTEEEMRTIWVDNRLTTACRNGDVLIYDEFNRSRPEANNALLSVLSEGIMDLSEVRGSGGSYLEVHPNFRAIFTSNPEEYAGVHRTANALLDRMITIRLGHYDRDTEVAITAARSGLDEESAQTLVDIVRELRGFGVNNHRPTVRSTIALARILARREEQPVLSNTFFRAMCHDILSLETAKVTHDGESLMPGRIDEALEKYCKP